MTPTLYWIIKALPHMKAYKLIIAALLLIAIGFAAGFYAHRQLSVKRIKNVAALRSAYGFEEHLFRIIQPSEEQKAQLRPIVEGYAGQIAENNRQSRLMQKSLVDSMRLEIKPFLTSEQVQQLDKFSHRFKGSRSGHRKIKEKNKTSRERKQE
jgi:hypothetical protein